MNRTFTLNGFNIAVHTNFRHHLTFVTVVKNEQVLMNEVFEKNPFEIDFENLVKDL